MYSVNVTALGKVCKACGTERKKKGIMYDPADFMPYCDNPYICNDEHPNSPKNLIARGTEMQLIPFEEAQEKFQVWLTLNHPDKEIAEKIKRMVKNPTTVRIGSPDLAQFIIETQNKFAFNSVADTIRYFIQLAMDNEGRFYKDYAEMVDEKKEKELEEEVNREIEEIANTAPVESVPEEPKEQQVTVPETEETDDEEWEF